MSRATDSAPVRGHGSPRDDGVEPRRIHHGAHALSRRASLQRIARGAPPTYPPPVAGITLRRRIRGCRCGESDRHKCPLLDDQHRGNRCSAFKVARLNPSRTDSTSSLARLRTCVVALKGIGCHTVLAYVSKMDDVTLRLINLYTGSISDLATRCRGPIEGVAWSPSGKLIAVVERCRSDAASGTLELVHVTDRNSNHSARCIPHGAGPAVVVGSAGGGSPPVAAEGRGTGRGV